MWKKWSLWKSRLFITKPANTFKRGQTNSWPGIGSPLDHYKNRNNLAFAVSIICHLAKASFIGKYDVIVSMHFLIISVCYEFSGEPWSWETFLQLQRWSLKTIGHELIFVFVLIETRQWIFSRILYRLAYSPFFELTDEHYQYKYSYDQAYNIQPNGIYSIMNKWGYIGSITTSIFQM